MGASPLNPENDDIGALPKSGGAFSASTGAWMVLSEVLVGGNCWADSLDLAGALKEDGDAIGSVLTGGIPLNIEAVGAGWTSLAGVAESDGPNSGLFISEPAPNTDVLLVLAEDALNNGDVDAWLARSPSGNDLVSSGPVVRFSFSPSHRGFSASFVGVT